MGIHIVKRDACPLWKKALFYLAAVAAALVVCGILLLAMGVNPLTYYSRMFTMGMVGNKIAYKTFENYLNVFVPLALTSVALSLAFKMRFWNIGGEGQFIVGAIAASTVALKLKPPIVVALNNSEFSFSVSFGPILSELITLVLMCLAAMLAAGLYGALVAALKVKFGTNETLLTLMLNYVALYTLTFLGDKKADWNFFLQEESARPVFQSFSDTAAFPRIMLGKFGLNICVILTLIIGVLVFVYLRYTKRGYEINVVGDSAGTAHYAGMKVNRIVLRTVFLSACLIGLAAAFKMGTTGVLSTTITGDVGWTGIIVAWLAQLNTAAIFVVSALISMLHYGSVQANTMFSNVDSSFANMLQGVILFLVLTADFFIRFRIVRTKKGGNQ
ncbi:MAG: ABC transporter permease [Ruminococcaceae bacterium]|nr:ABC transporter permease [Oscillospiraceae bacterium]